MENCMKTITYYQIAYEIIAGRYRKHRTINLLAIDGLGEWHYSVMLADLFGKLHLVSGYWGGEQTCFYAIDTVRTSSEINKLDEKRKWAFIKEVSEYLRIYFEISGEGANCFVIDEETAELYTIETVVDEMTYGVVDRKCCESPAGSIKAIGAKGSCEMVFLVAKLFDVLVLVVDIIGEKAARVYSIDAAWSYGDIKELDSNQKERFNDEVSEYLKEYMQWHIGKISEMVICEGETNYRMEMKSISAR